MIRVALLPGINVGGHRRMEMRIDEPREEDVIDESVVDSMVAGLQPGGQCLDGADLENQAGVFASRRRPEASHDRVPGGLLGRLHGMGWHYRERPRLSRHPE